mmetsp:Transcript_37099/g.77673  ORF Transcript_37099/g.77673 Transcript_37099/m.77673 type:complete len:368 (+) Transcript_37099:44-1147(+)
MEEDISNSFYVSSFKSMSNMAFRSRKTIVVLLIGLCTFASISSLGLLRNDQSPPPSSSTSEFNRNLRVYPWARHNLKLLGNPPNPPTETVSFWSIPKSGTSAVKTIYRCMNQTIANKAGLNPKLGDHVQDEERLTVFRPDKDGVGPAYMNVQTTTQEGILRAAKLGLVPSGLADIIFTGNPRFAIEHLYDRRHKGRILALFRHPVERLISKFYYVQEADWEKSYHPEYKQLSLLGYAKSDIASDRNIMVQKLSGKVHVTRGDLRDAMETVQRRFFVGLTNQMEESIRRFNVVIGIDQSDEEIKKCMDQNVGNNKRVNSNPHPMVEQGSPEWKALAEKNDLDIRLYDYVVQLFEEQRGIIESYAAALE